MLALETIRIKDKSSFYFSSLFLCTVGSGMKKRFGSDRDGKMLRAGIKHPGSATLVTGGLLLIKIYA
jgi:hypothetical protein